ncbi:MAG: hypothetical protein PVF54_08210 [Anaerolineae bacterium]|jgi:hypothetical protein
MTLPQEQRATGTKEEKIKRPEYLNNSPLLERLSKRPVCATT